MGPADRLGAPLAGETGSLAPASTPEASAAPGTRLPHSCRCGARWAGTRTAHCAGSCHLTFNGVSPFDDHRRGGGCVPPGGFGMRLIPGRTYECWGYPADENEDVS